MSDPDSWVYGDYAPDPTSADLVGFKARWLLRRLPSVPMATVLDYGVGEGKYLNLVRGAKPGARLVGVDIRKPHGSVDFEFRQVASGCALPFADGTFDLVVSCDVLEHVESITHSLDEIRRVLRRGGSFLGFIPAEGGVGPHGLLRLLDPAIFRDTKDHQYAYTRRELLKLLASRFRVVRLGYSYHLLGATMDAVFFASFKLPIVGSRVERFWRGEQNVIYRRDAAAKRRSMLGSIVSLANRLAYYESRILERCPLGAKGLHFHVQRL
jgi:SAM-dependent methyltransferase